MKTLLVVDGANVVGANPQGEWWKDRPGAAARLHESLMTADTAYDEVVLVLEGQTKQGVRAGRDAHLRTVHAPGNGDDTILREARLGVERGRTVAVVTADRRLKDRVHAVGATTLGPTWLLDRLA